MTSRHKGNITGTATTTILKRILRALEDGRERCIKDIRRETGANGFYLYQVKDALLFLTSYKLVEKIEKGDMVRYRRVK